MFRTVFVRSISALTVSGFVLAAQPLVADAGDDLVLAALFKSPAFAKDGDSGSSGSGSGGDSSGSGSSGSGSSGSGSGDSGSDGPGDGDGDSSGSDGPGDGDGDSSGHDGPGDNDGDNSGPGGGDDHDDDGYHDDDGDDGRGRGRGRGRGHDDDRHGHHSQPRNLMDFFSGSRERGAVVKAEMEGQSIEVTYTDGWKEEIEHGQYELKDPSNRTVVERPATQDDVDRLNSAF